MNKLIPLLAFSVLLLVPVGAQNAYAPFDVFFEVDVETVAGNAVAGAACTISDPGFGIIKSGVTDANGMYQEGVNQADIQNSLGIVDIQCTKGSASANEIQTVVTGGTTVPVNLVLDIVVGGEIIPIDATSLILAGAQTPAVWMISAFSALGIGAFWFTRNPYNVRNIKVIFQDYLDRF